MHPDPRSPPPPAHPPSPAAGGRNNVQPADHVVQLAQLTARALDLARQPPVRRRIVVSQVIRNAVEFARADAARLNALIMPPPVRQNGPVLMPQALVLQPWPNVHLMGIHAPPQQIAPAVVHPAVDMLTLADFPRMTSVRLPAEGAGRLQAGGRDNSETLGEGEVVDSDVTVAVNRAHVEAGGSRKRSRAGRGMAADRLRHRIVSAQSLKAKLKDLQEEVSSLKEENARLMEKQRKMAQIEARMLREEQEVATAENAAARHGPNLGRCKTCPW